MNHRSSQPRRSSLAFSFFYLAFASITLLFHTETAIAANCAALGDGKFADRLQQRKERYPKLCGSGSPMEKQLIRTRQQIETCTRIEQAISSNKAPINLDTMKHVTDRIGAACRAYQEYIRVGEMACQSGDLHEQAADQVKAKAANIPEGAGQKEILDDIACSTRTISDGYDNLAAISRDLKKSVQNNIQNIRENQNPADQNMSIFINSLKNQIESYTKQVGDQARLKLAQREKMASSQNDPEANMGAIRFRTQKDVDNFYTALLQCKEGAKSLDQFEKVYQNLVAKELALASKESEAISTALDAKKAEYRNLSDQYRDRSNRLTAEVGKNDGTPLLVSPTANVLTPAIDSPNALTDAQDKLRRATLILRSVDACKWDKASGFKVKTNDGRYSDITARHVTKIPTGENIDLQAVPANDQLKTPTVVPFSRCELVSAEDKGDICAKFDGEAGAALTPISHREAIPREGQKFIIGGAPQANYEGAYTNMECTYVGGGPNGQMVLDCPTRNTFIGGMSGGPAVDANTGKVWGLVTHQGVGELGSNTYRDTRVFIAPVSQTDSGQLLSGPTTNYSMGTCWLNVNTRISQPCDISPSGTSFR